MSVNVNSYSTGPSADLSNDTDGVVANADDAEMYRTTIMAHTGTHTYGGVLRPQGDPGGFSDCPCLLVVGASLVLSSSPRRHSGMVGLQDPRYTNGVMLKFYGPDTKIFEFEGIITIETPKPA